MDYAARRPLLAAATLTTVGALALTPVAVAPHDVHLPSLSPTVISTQAVQLTDAWSDLVGNTLGSALQLGALFVGADSTFPIPNPIFIAPVLTQLLVVNPLIYTVQLFTGQGAKIPNEILTHLSNVAGAAEILFNQVPPIIVDQIRTPFLAAQLAIESVATATNKLIALLEAPAVFLDAALNSQYGLIGINGPIAVPIILRNLLANSLQTPLPTITLPFKKPASALTPAPAATSAVAAKTAAPSKSASSARTRSKAPATAGSSRKASEKAGSNSAGTGRSKRN